MKVIFLDIDGVLNCQSSKSKLVIDDVSYKGIDKHKIMRLKSIIEKTDAKVVLTSSWRLHLYKKDVVDKYMRQRFGNYQIEIFSCVDYFKNNRGAGIHLWLLEHPDVTNWVVLDDEWFMDYDDEIGKHIILTEFYNNDGGLRDGHIDEACDILGGKLNDMTAINTAKPEGWTHVGLSDYID